jgi:hydroxymethylbilane synthase
VAEPIRLGTRGSALALAQAGRVAELLEGAEVVPVATPEQSEAPGGDKARFVRGVERALLDGEVDLGVHSAKDVPSDLPPELAIVGVPERADSGDAYVGSASTLDEIPQGARIGTSSLRRRAQLLAIRPDLEVTELRGNVDTRLERLREGNFDGIVLALAGLERLGREDEAAFRFSPDQMTPAAGQGALMLEARRDDIRPAAAAQTITDRDALAEVTAERTVVRALDADCTTPVGVHAQIANSTLLISAFVGLPDGSEWVRDTVEGDASDPAALGDSLAGRLLAAGAADVLARAGEVAAE